ncbi:MATE family efflux transporter [Aestuariibius sp. HNIBRBA575]|uniref:MATE family efflux transporter n=1 Tax=Aestuariibius sp. HNIBRBA575 TaxID=3233343 RepID=UPI0034A22055
MTNAYLTAPLGRTFLKTAAPIVLIMLVNGLFNVVDAYFLGQFTGPDAVVAVTLVFPLFMMIIALSTLVSGGFSSVFARAHGAGQDTADILTSACRTALGVCLVLIAGFVIWGRGLTYWIANEAQILADMGHLYLSVLIWGAPLGFALGLGIDTLRATGRLRLMTFVTLSSALLNILFDWVLIVGLDWGVFGSAMGTLLAQACAFCLILFTWSMPVPRLFSRLTTSHSQQIIALGLPQSLGYVGLSLGSAVTLYALQIWQTADYETYSGAFGLLTRLMTFVFLPLLGLSMAFQTLISNNYGAGLTLRVQSCLRIGIIAAFVYMGTMQVLFLAFAPVLGAVFVSDQAMIDTLAHIIWINSWSMVLFGPLLMIGTYYMAIGDAARAGLLMLSRTYLFSIPLTLALPFVFGGDGIWLAGVLAELLVAIVTIVVLIQTKPIGWERANIPT